MPLNKPLKRTCRQHTNGSYSDSGKWMYVLHPRYANSPENYIRAFLLIQKDLMQLFDFIEPSDTNIACYSYRVHELLLRTCVEVEANLKAILNENGYQRSGNWNMRDDYSKVNQSHRLSSYEIKVPNWNGNENVRRPYQAWLTNGPLPWYQAYNNTKHDRHERFEEANFNHLIDAFCGLAALMASQFYTHDYSPSDWLISAGGLNDGYEFGIGGYLRIKFPDDWPEEDRYEFNWQDLENEEDPFGQYQY
jgi:hypothetical protein